MTNRKHRDGDKIDIDALAEDVVVRVVCKCIDAAVDRVVADMAGFATALPGRATPQRPEDLWCSHAAGESVPHAGKNSPAVLTAAPAAGDDEPEAKEG